MKQRDTATSRVLRNSAMLDVFGIKSPDTVYRWERTIPDFPKRVRLSDSGRATGFFEHEVEAYLERRAAARKAG